MPAFIRSKKDEEVWASAKKEASKQLSESDGDSYWKLTNYIYHNMRKAREELASLSKADEPKIPKMPKEAENKYNNFKKMGMSHEESLFHAGHGDVPSMEHSEPYLKLVKRVAQAHKVNKQLEHVDNDSAPELQAHAQKETKLKEHDKDIKSKMNDFENSEEYKAMSPRERHKAKLGMQAKTYTDNKVINRIGDAYNHYNELPQKKQEQLNEHRLAVMTAGGSHNVDKPELRDKGQTLRDALSNLEFTDREADHIVTSDPEFLHGEQAEKDYVADPYQDITGSKGGDDERVSVGSKSDPYVGLQHLRDKWMKEGKFKNIAPSSKEKEAPKEGADKHIENFVSNASEKQLHALKDYLDSGLQYGEDDPAKDIHAKLKNKVHEELGLNPEGSGMSPEMQKRYEALKAKKGK